MPLARLLVSAPSSNHKKEDAMPILSIAVNESGTINVHEAVVRRLRETGPMPPPGLIFQAAAHTDVGFQVFSLWDSMESLARFRDERLTPTLEAEGIDDDVSFSTHEAISYLVGTPAQAANEIATSA
jgi:hypothetical protein